MQLGESFVGDGVNAAHVNTIIGPRDGPVGSAWATALATPSAGHAPFVVVMQPDLPVKPFTLFVNKATIESDAHANITWGAAQAGVASGVADAVYDLLVATDDVLIAAVWVNPQADDAETVWINNRRATREALQMGCLNGPFAGDAVGMRDRAWNPFFRAR